MSSTDWIKLAVALMLFVFGSAGLLIAVLRHYLGTLAAGQKQLFADRNSHEQRIVTLEKWALLQGHDRTVLLNPTRKQDG